MGIRLPSYGEWHVSNNLIAEDAPFAIIKVSFRGTPSGSVRWRQVETPLRNIRVTGPDRFTANYSIRGKAGLIEAVYRTDQVLEMTLKGGVATSCIARPSELVGGDRPVATWDTGEKIVGAVNRSIPHLPAGVRDEVAAMLTPQALATMGGVLAVWGAAHYVGVGFVADLIIVVTGAAMLGSKALEGAEKLVQFVDRARNAASEADLDAAARLFAEAVTILGITTVMTVLMYRGIRPGGRARGTAPQRTSRPAGPGEPPTGLNTVPVSRIPPASRVGGRTWWGESPRLDGVAKPIADQAKLRLNALREHSLECFRRGKMKEDIDCELGSEQIASILGRGADVIRDTARPPETGGIHSMIRIGDEVICTRPGFWREIFAGRPQVEQALARRDPSWPERLRHGIVMTLREFDDFVSGASRTRPPPESPMFDFRRIDPRRGGGAPPPPPAGG